MTKWPMVLLGDLMHLRTPDVDVCSEGEYHFAGVYCFGGGAFVGQKKTGLEFAYNRLTRLHAQDFTYPKLMAWEGAFAVVPPECDGLVVSTEFPVFKIDENKVVPDFIGYYFKRASVWPRVAGNSTGTNVRRRRLHPSDFLRHRIALPPLDEQQRLVEYLNALIAKLDEAKVLRQSVAEAVPRLWEQTLLETFDAITRNSSLKRFGDVCSVVRGGSPRPAGSQLYYDGDIPFLKVGDLTRDETKTVETHTATIKQAGLSRTRWVEPGTLMLTNSGATLGVPKICTFGTTFNDGIQAFLGLPEELNKEYLYYFLRAKTRWFREWAARGQGQPNLNTEMVKQMMFPCPDAITQLKTVQFLDELRQKLDDLESQQYLVQNELIAILPAALDRVFNPDEAQA